MRGVGTAATPPLLGRQHRPWARPPAPLSPSPRAAGAGWFWSSRIRAHDRTGRTKIWARVPPPVPLFPPSWPHSKPPSLAVRPLLRAAGRGLGSHPACARPQGSNCSFCGVVLYNIYIYLGDGGARLCGWAPRGCGVRGGGVFIAFHNKRMGAVGLGSPHSQGGLWRFWARCPVGGQPQHPRGGSHGGGLC